MARIRTIKPGFFSSLTITELPKATRLTFIGIWTFVDDDGRAVDDSRLVKAEVWPLDDDYGPKRISDDLEKLEKAGLIERYQVDGRRYLRVVNWAEHQRINRPQASKLPKSPSECVKPQGTITELSVNRHGSDSEPSRNDHGAITEPSLPEGKGREGKGKEDSLSSRSDLQPAIPKICESESERQRAAELCEQAGRLLRWPRGKLDGDEIVRLVWWALAHLDPNFLDEILTSLDGLDDAPRLPSYLAVTIRDRASQASIDMPPWRRTQPAQEAP